MLTALVDRVEGLLVAGAGSHVADVEVEIKAIEERCRSIEASLPVPVLSKHLEHLVYHAAGMRNIIIRKGRSISEKPLPARRPTERKTCVLQSTADAGACHQYDDQSLDDREKAWGPQDAGCLATRTAPESPGCPTSTP